jgi:uracil-DNA glycosylase
MANHPFNLACVHPSWLPYLDQGIAAMDAAYLEQLAQSSDWLPGPEKIFSAFSLPVDKVNYILFGESPYPRAQSANGYAFWDAAVTDIWSPSGLSKPVNRATSLRNIIKMLLIAEEKLSPDNTSQDSIATVDKTNLIHSNHQLFNNLLSHGFLLLNTTLVLGHESPKKDAKEWLPFMRELLACLVTSRPDVNFILFGLIANTINPLIPPKSSHCLYAEHPYNLSFITNPKVLSFFKPFHLLRAS